MSLCVATVSATVSSCILLQVHYISEREERLRILESCHSEPTSGHLGLKKTVAHINWPGIIKDVNEFVSYNSVSIIYSMLPACKQWS